MNNQIILNGNHFAKILIEQLKPRIINRKIPPFLHIINIGNNPASISYIKKKTQLAQSLGIQSKVYQFQESSNIGNQSLNEVYLKVERLIDQLNLDSTCTGILLQLPLPHHYNPTKILQRISPSKDVDCLTQTNRKNLLVEAENASILPCTPAAILKIIDYHKIQICSKKVTLIGRSNLVGMPLAYLLLNRNATLTVCHKGTQPSDVLKFAKDCDILIAAAGSPQLIKQVKHGGVVIDIGISKIQNRLVGDVSQKAKKQSKFYTPVPGGVGPLTVAMLMQNTIKLWQLSQLNK